MKMTEIKSFNATDVDKKVDEIKNQLFDLKIQKVTSGIEKPHEKNNLKKSIARLLTHKNSLKAEGNK